MRRPVALLAVTSALLAAPSAHAEPPAKAPGPTKTSTAPIPIRFDQAFVRARGDELSVASREADKPLFAEWWFWGAVGLVVSGVVVTGVVLSSGGTFVPDGELGNSSTADWNRF